MSDLQKKLLPLGGGQLIIIEKLPELESLVLGSLPPSLQSVGSFNLLQNQYFCNQFLKEIKKGNILPPLSEIFILNSSGTLRWGKLALQEDDEDTLDLSGGSFLNPTLDSFLKDESFRHKDRYDEYSSQGRVESVAIGNEILSWGTSPEELYENVLRGENLKIISSPEQLLDNNRGGLDVNNPEETAEYLFSYFLSNLFFNEKPALDYLHPIIQTALKSELEQLSLKASVLLQTLLTFRSGENEELVRILQDSVRKEILVFLKSETVKEKMKFSCQALALGESSRLIIDEIYPS